METWYVHGLPKQTELTETEPSTTDKGEDINTGLRRINLTWRWIAPTTGEPTASTGENTKIPKETEDAEMTPKNKR